MTTLLIALLSSASAQEQVASADLCTFAAIETPPPTRPPDAPAPTRDFVKCVVTAEVDATGKPSVKLVEECAEPFASAARAGIAAWRFQQCTLTDGRGVEGTVKVSTEFASSEFQTQGDAALQAIRDMHQTIAARKDGSCALEARVLPDGTVERLATSDPHHCLVGAKQRTLKHLYLELDKQVSCTLEFDVSHARPDKKTATVKGCEGDLATYTINALTSFAYNSPIGGVEHYTVKVTLGP